MQTSIAMLQSILLSISHLAHEKVERHIKHKRTDKNADWYNLLTTPFVADHTNEDFYRWNLQ